MWTVAVETAPDAAVRDAIARPLRAHNLAAMGTGDWGPFAITVRDGDGAIAGGLWGDIWYGFLFVELLALGDASGEGLGRQVMELAEAEARRRGCTGIWLDTFTWQAPWFYPKLGFEEFGRIERYVGDQDRIFLVKRLTAPAQAGPGG